MPMVWFCGVPTHFFMLSLSVDTLYNLIRGLSILLFSFINKVDFSLSAKGCRVYMIDTIIHGCLLICCWFWIFVRVFNSNRNFISTSAHVWSHFITLLQSQNLVCFEMVISGQVRSRVGELYIWLFWRHIPQATSLL